MMKGSSTAPLLIAVVIVGVGITAFILSTPQATVNVVETGIDQGRTITKANTLASYTQDDYLREAIDFNFEATTYDLAQKGGGFPLWTPEEQKLRPYAIPNVTEIEERLERGATNRFEEEYLWNQPIGDQGNIDVPDFPYEIHERYDVFNGSVTTRLVSKVDLFFAFDTSGSMHGDIRTVCGIRNQIENRLAAEGVDARVIVGGIKTGVRCGSQVIPSGSQTYGAQGSLETWGYATEWAVTSYSGWRSGATKLIFPASDECAGGNAPNGCGLRSSVDDAITAVNNAGATVYPIWGLDAGDDGWYDMERLGAQTGGKVYLSSSGGALADKIVEAATRIVMEEITNGGGTNYSGWSRDHVRFEFRSESDGTYAESYAADHLNNVSRGNRYFYQYNISQTFAHSLALRKTLSRAAHNVSNMIVVDRADHVGECNDASTCDQLDPSSKPSWYPNWDDTVEEAVTNKQERVVRKSINDTLITMIDEFMEDFNDSQDNYRQYRDIFLNLDQIDVEFELLNDPEQLDRFETLSVNETKNWVVEECMESGCGDPPDQECSTSDFVGKWRLDDSSLQRGTSPMVSEDPWYFEHRFAWGLRGIDDEPRNRMEHPYSYGSSFGVADPNYGVWSPPSVRWIANTKDLNKGPRMVSETETIDERLRGDRTLNQDDVSITPVLGHGVNVMCGPDESEEYNHVVQRWRNGWWFDKLKATVSIEFTAVDRKYERKVAPHIEGEALLPQTFTVLYRQNQTVEFNRTGHVQDFSYPTQDITWTRTVG